MTRIYGGVAVHRLEPGLYDTWGINQNAVTMPNANQALNATSIPSTTASKTTDLYKTLSVYNHLANNQESGSNYFSLMPGIKYPGYDGGAGNTGNSVSFGAFGAALTTSTDLAVPANRWNIVVRGMDSRFSGVDSTAGRYNLNAYYKRYELAMPAATAGGSVQTTITVEKGLYITGAWLERISSGSGWWSPSVSLMTNAEFPTTGTSVTVLLQSPTGFSCVAGVYRIVVVGLLNPPFPLTRVRIPLTAALAIGSGAGYTVACPQDFRLFGCYGASVNNSNWFGPSCWGITQMVETTNGVTASGKFNGVITSIRIRVDNPQGGHAVAANAWAVDCVGICAGL